MHWWRKDLFSSIIPSSFEDSNHDGSGDLPGFQRRLDSIQQLANMPIYPSLHSSFLFRGDNGVAHSDRSSQRQQWLVPAAVHREPDGLELSQRECLSPDGKDDEVLIESRRRRMSSGGHQARSREWRLQGWADEGRRRTRTWSTTWPSNSSSVTSSAKIHRIAPARSSVSSSSVAHRTCPATSSRLGMENLQLTKELRE